MLRSILFFIAVFFVSRVFTQVGVGTTTPHPSAQLDIASSNKGFLPPRMTTAQRDAITNPAPGLMIFNTSTQSIEIFTDYGWYGIQVQIPERKLMGGVSNEETYSIRQTSEGGFIVAGHSGSSESGDVTGVNTGGFGRPDFWIVKLDASRNISWNKLVGGNGDEMFPTVQQTADGGYIVAGRSNSSATGDVSEISNGGYDYWIIKLDGSGNIEWQRLIGGSGDDEPKSIIQTADKGFIVTGRSNSSADGYVSGVNHGGFDYWVVKLDDQGNIEWDNLYGGTGSDEAQSIIQGADETYIVAGYSSSSHDGNVSGTNHGNSLTVDFWIVRLNATGSILWEKLLGGSEDEIAHEIYQTSDGSYIVAGSTTSSANGDVSGINHGAIFGSPDFWIVKLDRFGNISWDKLFGGENFDQAFSIQQTSDGGYITAGYSSTTANGDVTGSSRGNADYWVVKLDAAGSIVWNRLIGGSGFDFAYTVRQTSDGGFIVGGFTNSSYTGEVTGGNHGSYDFWIVKLGAEGFVY